MALANGSVCADSFPPTIGRGVGFCATFGKWGIVVWLPEFVKAGTLALLAGVDLPCSTEGVFEGDFVEPEVVVEEVVVSAEPRLAAKSAE